MILPVSNLQTKNTIKQNFEPKNKIAYRNQNINPTQTLIQSKLNIAFKGTIEEDETEVFFNPERIRLELYDVVSYDGVEYSNKEVEIAKKYMHAKDTSWRDTLYQKALKNAKRYNHLGDPSDIASISHYKTPTGRFIAKMVLGAGSLGVHTLLDTIYQRISPSCDKQARIFVDSISTLIQHLKNEELINANKLRQAEIDITKGKLDKKLADVEAQNQAAIAKTEYLNKLSSKKNQLATEFLDKLNIEKQGSHIDDIPNVIMIEDPYDDVSNELIDYTRRNAQSRFIKLSDIDNDTLMDNLDETLKNSKKHFDLTKERTLIHVEGFDRLITKGGNSFENIESLKDIMCKTAKDFGSTIIFKTKNASKLVSEAIQPQRVLRILANFKSVI